MRARITMLLCCRSAGEAPQSDTRRRIPVSGDVTALKPGEKGRCRGSGECN